MNPTDARSLAMEYIRRLERNDLDGALSLTTPEARFWTPGPGEMNRQQMRAFFEPVGKLVEKIVFTLDGSTVEGDRVALELRSEAKLTNGRDYRNRYHFLFILRGDKIAEVREYADSAPAQAAFF